MVESLFSHFWPLVWASGVVLVVLAALQVWLSRRLIEEVERDEGRYWHSLPWEVRGRKKRPITVLSWIFGLLFIVTLVYGVGQAYYLSHPPGF
jgi:hypothetical protein